jgi:3',5'-cyclic AMP phosphodiesterase CpdA
MKKAVFLLLAVLLVFPGCNQKKEAHADEFTFAFLTDIHLMPELDGVEGFRKAIDAVNEINPDFVLTGGDLIHDALDQTYGRADSLYSLYNQTIEEFNMPVYNTIGNHEIYGWHRDEEGIEDHPEYGKKMFENRIGKRYYSFDHKGWHFIVLDGMELAENGHYFGRVDDEQIEWLKEDLEKTGKETPIAVSIHIPFISVQAQLKEGGLASNPRYLIINNSRDVLMNFWGYNLKLVLQGHLHFLEDIYVDNQVHFITAGAVSGLWWNNKTGTRPEEGFLVIRVKGEEFDWEYVDFGWVTESQRRGL